MSQLLPKGASANIRYGVTRFGLLTANLEAQESEGQPDVAAPDKRPAKKNSGLLLICQAGASS
jgi:hypothetical protein